MKIVSKFLIVTLLLLSMGLMLTGFQDSEITKSPKLNTAGEVTFTVRTVPSGGNYAPKHVLAIWVEYNGDFVKTRKAMANQRKQYLYTWKAASNYNVVDAITGPTLNSHQTHTVTWDCTDLDGNLVPDGEYEIWVEFTDKHAQGPLYTIAFDKGPETQSMTPPDETYFKDLELYYTPFIADFMADVTDVCQEETVNFTDMSTGANSWEWEFGEGATPANANTQGPHAVTYSSPGPKNVTLTINGTIVETKENYISVNPTPQAEFSFAGSNYTVEFTNESTNANSYLWDFGDGNTSNDNNPIHTYAEAGSYEVTLTAYYLECENNIMHEVSVPLTGIQIPEANSLNIYPNPGNGKFYLQVKEVQENASWNLYHPSGSVVRKGILGQGNKTFHLDFSDLPKGIYIFEITTSTTLEAKKLVLE